jgi:hypothetical protein
LPPGALVWNWVQDNFRTGCSAKLNLIMG